MSHRYRLLSLLLITICIQAADRSKQLNVIGRVSSNGLYRIKGDTITFLSAQQKTDLDMINNTIDMCDAWLDICIKTERVNCHPYSREVLLDYVNRIVIPVPYIMDQLHKEEAARDLPLDIQSKYIFRLKQEGETFSFAYTFYPHNNYLQRSNKRTINLKLTCEQLAPVGAESNRFEEAVFDQLPPHYKAVLSLKQYWHILSRKEKDKTEEQRKQILFNTINGLRNKQGNQSSSLPLDAKTLAKINTCISK